MFVVVLSWLCTALAGGPWVPGTGNTSLYIGIDGQRFTQLSASGGDGRETLDVGEGLSYLTTSLQLSHGLAPRIAVEFAAPFHHGQASRADAQLCADLGLDACKTTNTIGILTARAKGLLLDELGGSPVSLAVSGEVRFGGFAAEARGRLTGPGPGTLDLGPVVSVGRSGALASGYFAVSLDLGWRYRVPHTNSYPLLQGDETAPHSEFHGALDLILAPLQEFGIGPSVQGLVRPGGRDFKEIEIADIDRFSSLRIGQLRIGGKMILKDKKHNAFIFSVHRTVVAWNNPSDVFAVGAGVNIANLFARKGA